MASLINPGSGVGAFDVWSPLKGDQTLQTPPCPFEPFEIKRFKRFKRSSVDFVFQDGQQPPPAVSFSGDAAEGLSNDAA